MCSVSVYTLGCKLNQLESEGLAGAFAAAGFALIPWGGAADLLVINTCTVTSRADQKARRVIRKALRDNPASCVIVTGCYAQLDPHEIAALDAEAGGAGRLLVIKGGVKSSLLDLPRYLRDNQAPAGELRRFIGCWNEERQFSRQKPAVVNPTGAGSFDFQPGIFSFHTRGFLKIQDGCNNHCTYCRIRFARGPSVSSRAEQILAELLDLEARGYAEAVLTGVNISQYRDGGAGPAEGRDLAGLLELLLAGSRSIALRLSSLEPEYLTERFAAVLAHPRIRPHFHLSVQSGSSDILKKMGRSYDPETVERGAALLRSIKDNPFLACDIITGFPGETEAEFEQTLNLCAKIRFAWIHVFPYSKRPGTAACSFREPVSERETAYRVEALLALARQDRRNYIQQWTGREVEALVEKRDTGRDGYCRAVSENYLKLLIQYGGTEAPGPGTRLRCKVGAAVLSEHLDGEGPGYDAEAQETAIGIFQ
jgi:threonylcarbamoyladenosine tRNA methylthiotransferase MtaB